MINAIQNKELCCGCEGCIQACPTKCIDKIIDEEGFEYPVVNEKSCVKCSICRKVCPIITKEEINEKNNINVFAAYDVEENDRLSSTSGGIFGVLAKEILKDNGVVFGAAFDKKFNVKHIYIETIDELPLIKGSKYVQSSIDNSYIQVQNFLKEGRKVLFTGVPCQIYGLYNFLGKEFSNLLTCSVVCHGVPSPEIFKKYKKYLEKKYKSSIKSIDFRKKINGWTKSHFSVKFINNKEYSVELGKDPFTNSFQCDLFSRPSCHKCKFKELPCKSDILLGDFWGIEIEKPELFDEKGVSLIITNTKKANELIYNLNNKIVKVECNIKNALKRNPCILSSAKAHSTREKFMKDYASNKEFEYLIKKYMKPTIVTLKSRVVNKIKKIYNK